MWTTSLRVIRNRLRFDERCPTALVTKQHRRATGVTNQRNTAGKLNKHLVPFKDLLGIQSDTASEREIGSPSRRSIQRQAAALVVNGPATTLPVSSTTKCVPFLSMVVMVILFFRLNWRHVRHTLPQPNFGRSLSPFATHQSFQIAFPYQE